MTVSSSTNRASYSGNGSLATFAYGFKVFDQSDLTVILRAANGTETVQTITTHYTVTGVGSASGGNVVFGTAPASGVTVVIIREQPLTQGLDLVPNDPFPAQSLEESLDKLTFVDQRLSESIDRALTFSVGDFVTDATLPFKEQRVGKVLAFNETTGDPEAGPTIADAQSIANVSADIALLADIQDGTVATNTLTNLSSIRTDVTTVSGISANVTTVAGVSANVTTVAGVSANVTTVAGVSSEVATLGPIATDITAVASNNTNVTTVATNINAVNTVASNITNINTVANDLLEVVSEIETVANDLNEATSEIEVVANNIANVNTVGTISGNVTTVAGISADVTAVAADASDIGVVATNIVNVNAVGGISGNVTTVAGISSDVTTVAAISADISTVANTDLTAVINNSASIATVGTNIANVNTVATNVSSVTNVSNNISSVNSFSSQYTISASEPSSPNEGLLWFDTSTDTMKVYNGNSFQNAGSSVNGTSSRGSFTATAGQTSFATTGYDSGYIDVYLNGVKLIEGTDFTATDGVNFVLTTGAALNDTLDYVAYGTFNLADVYTKTVSDARYLQLGGGTLTGALLGTTLNLSGELIVGGNLTVSGTTTTVNSTTLDVADLNITVANGAADAAAANGAGLTVDGAAATILYQATGDKWTMNKPLDVSGTVNATAFTGDGSGLTGVGFTTNVVTASTTATKDNHYYLNGATLTLTLPASPTVGDEVRLSEVAGNTDCIVGRNGSNIMSDASDLTIDSAYLVLSLRYVDATIGWAFS
jgi:hypothetical protein